MKKRAEEKKDKSWKDKVAYGILKPIEKATTILLKPPKNMEEAERILSVCRDEEKNKTINEELDKFLHGKYEPKDFIEEIKKTLGADTSVEALDLYINIKDLFLDQKMFQAFDELVKLQAEAKQQLEETRTEIRNDIKGLFNGLKEIENKLLAIDEGFNWLTGVDFDGIEGGIEDWLKGYPFYLKDIYSGFDYRRKIV